MNCCQEDHEIDALLNDAEEATFFESYRSKKLQEICAASNSCIDHQNQKNYSNDSSESWGYLTEIGHEKEVMHLSTHLPRLLIHFYNPSFKNCQLLNEHLKKLARRFPATRFIYIEASKAPFLIVKMKIQVLPCLISIVDTIIADRLIGFEDLGGTDQFTTKQLEERLATASRIFNIPHKLKKSMDRRDRDSDDE